MKLIAAEQSRLSKVAGDGSTFEEGYAAGRIALLMDLLVGGSREEVPETMVKAATRGIKASIGNGAAAETAVTRE